MMGYSEVADLLTITREANAALRAGRSDLAERQMEQIERYLEGTLLARSVDISEGQSFTQDA